MGFRRLIVSGAILLVFMLLLTCYMILSFIIDVVTLPIAFVVSLFVDRCVLFWMIRFVLYKRITVKNREFKVIRLFQPLTLLYYWGDRHSSMKEAVADFWWDNEEHGSWTLTADINYDQWMEEAEKQV